MSGTEAVMQAVRLARYHTGRSHAVRFAGAYHGWWDGVQAGPGNPRPARDVYTLEELSERTLRVLRTRDDIAVVLVNPIQAMNPNAPPPTDGTLVSDERRFRYDRAAYAAWLRALREVCSERGIALLLDEVFLGFRLARGGAQAYFGVEADLVTWGKTLGGGLPVGVLCGKARWMRRYREGSPADLCFARGTFNAHPCVMTAMDGMLRHLDRPEVAAQYATLDATWEARAAALNGRLAEAGVPVRVGAFTAVWTTLYTQPGRYHWMFQYYLRAEGLLPAWIGSGRFIFSHATTDGEFSVIADRFVAAAEAMAADGWWWTDGALTTKRIRRTLLVELVRAKLGLRPVVGPTALPAPGPAPEAAVRAASR
jgi:glutamate-1-semialdehyde 2,1-aminomutase